MTIRLLTGDALEVLRTLPADSAHVCVTSPPYFNLRDYGIAGQIGAEKSVEEYVERLVTVFREVKRGLRPEGTLWINLGDCYAEKSLVGVPWRVAFALQADGWYLRAEIVWWKRGCLPEPVKDRPTRNHESIFLLSKQPAYFYDRLNAREPAVLAGKKSGNKERRHAKGDVREKDRGFATAGFPWVQGAMRNWRTVWDITNKPFKGAHFASYPPEIPERAILAGSSDFGACLECGAPWVRIVEKVGGPPPGDTKDKGFGVQQGDAVGRPGDARGRNAQLREVYDTFGYPEWKTAGSKAGCEHEFQGLTEPCTVLDPFCGAATTGLVAGKLGRHFVGIELNPAYVQLAAERLRSAGFEPEIVGEVIPELEGVEA